MQHLSTTEYRINIREFEDEESESQRAWIVDVLDMQGNCIIEAAGVSSSLMKSMEEAGHAITLQLANEWMMARANERA